MFATFPSKPQDAAVSGSKGTKHPPSNNNHNVIKKPSEIIWTALSDSNRNADTHPRNQTKVVDLTGGDEYEEPYTSDHYAKDKNGSITRRLPTLSQSSRHKSRSKSYTPRETDIERAQKNKLARGFGVVQNGPRNRSQNHESHGDLDPNIKRNKERGRLNSGSSLSGQSHPNNRDSQARVCYTDHEPTPESQSRIAQEVVHEDTKSSPLSATTQQVPTGDRKSSLADMASSSKGDLEYEKGSLRKHVIHDGNRDIVDGEIFDSVRTNAESTTSEHSAKIIHSIEGLDPHVETHQQSRSGGTVNENKNEIMQTPARGGATSAILRQRSEKQTYNHFLRHERLAKRTQADSGNTYGSIRSPSEGIRDISSGSISHIEDKVNTNTGKLALTHNNLLQSHSKAEVTGKALGESKINDIYPGSPTEVATDDGDLGELEGIQDSEQQQNPSASRKHSDTDNVGISIDLPFIPVQADALNGEERILPQSASQEHGLQNRRWGDAH